MVFPSFRKIAHSSFVTGTTVTFEEMPVAADALATRIAALTRTHPWLVAASADGIAGHAYAGPWRTRAAYRHAAECSLHVAPAHAGRGVGRALYTALCARLREMGWKLGRRIDVGYWQRLL